MPIQWLHKQESTVMRKCNFVNTTSHVSSHMPIGIYGIQGIDFAVPSSVYSMCWSQFEVMMHHGQGFDPQFQNLCNSGCLTDRCVSSSPKLEPASAAVLFTFRKLWKTVSAATTDLKVRNVWYGYKSVPGRTGEAILIPNWLYSHYTFLWQLPAGLKQVILFPSGLI